MTHTLTNMKIRRLYLVYVAKFKSLNKERICLKKFNLCGIVAPRVKTPPGLESLDISAAGKRKFGNLFVGMFISFNLLSYRQT